jgi:hypothetical protein
LWHTVPFLPEVHGLSHMLSYSPVHCALGSQPCHLVLSLTETLLTTITAGHPTSKSTTAALWATQSVSHNLPQPQSSLLTSLIYFKELKMEIISQ